MRVALVIVVFVAFTQVSFAQQTYTSSDGKFSIKFPNAPKVTENTNKTDVGELTVTSVSYAHSDGRTFIVSYTDYPANLVNDKTRSTFFNAIRDGVKGKDGKLVGKDTELTTGTEKTPGREFTVEKGKRRVRYRLFMRDQRLYQVAVAGTSSFVTSREANAFFDSLDLTK